MPFFVENSSSVLPRKEDNGSFWKDRSDRFHCGIDFYAKDGSKVFSIDSGKVVKTGVFTSPDQVYYWNKTFYVDVKLKNDLFCRYAELGNIDVSEGDELEKGDIVGFVGSVLNKDKINSESPDYIRKLADSGNFSMLHFGFYRNNSIDVSNKWYLGGNWFCVNRPDGIIDPTPYLANFFKN